MNTPFTIFRISRSDCQSEILYPELWDIPHPPQELYIQGRPESLELLKRLPESGLAVVGTRNPQFRSLLLTQNWIHSLKGTHMIILSGLARGIDAAAHQASLSAGLPTIAILGAGLNIPYPMETFSLRKKILQAGGLLVSEFSPNQRAYKSNFLRRNRMIAGWSKATWVVEAGYRSGALNTAKWAREMSKTCFATPHFPNDPSFEGNQTLLDRDHALACWGPHSLGAAWLELSTLEIRRTMMTHPEKKELPPPFSEENQLVQAVKNLTHQKGGAIIQDLLSWAEQNQWQIRNFYLHLQATLQKQRIQNMKGWFISY